VAALRCPKMLTREGTSSARKGIHRGHQWQTVLLFACRSNQASPGRQSWTRDHTEENASIDRQKELTALRALRCYPNLWRHFSDERTSRTSKFREFLVYNFVNLSIPANRSQRNVAEQIAKEAHIPIESLPDELDQIVSPRGQTFFGFAGDLFDQTADNVDNMKWWVSDHGLNMGIVSPADPGRVPTLDELLDKRMLDISGLPGSVRPESELSGEVPDNQGIAVPKENRKAKKPRRQNKRYEAIDAALMKIAESHPTNHEEVFALLDGRAKPPAAEPFDSAGGWLKGFEKAPRAARSWLSKRWRNLGLPPFAPGPK
jgi:hypothetical protein